MRNKAKPQSVETFRLPRLCQITFFWPPVVASLIALFTVRGHLMLSLVMILNTVLFVAMNLVYTVQVSSEGVRVYGIWWLPWHDVQEVRRYDVFGLPYFKVKRTRGIRVHIPLYFVGAGDLRQAIFAAAPSGHPFRCAV